MLVINVEDFKSLAVGNDYTEAIKTAVNAVGVGAKIEFPKNKEILVSQSININSNTVIDFANVSISSTGNFRPISVVGTPENPKKNVHIKNLDVTLNATGMNQTGLQFSYAENCTYENVNISNPGLNGVEIFYSKNVHGKNINIYTPKSFGILYYLSENCTDTNMTVEKSTSWAHQFKSSKKCTSYDIRAIEPQQEYGLYMWSGYGDALPALKPNEYCGYINPYVKGTSTSRHLIYINASPNSFIENPILEQANGGWVPIAINGSNTVDNGIDPPFIVDCSGTRITNPTINSVGETPTITFTGTSDRILKDCSIIDGKINGGKLKCVIFQYTEAHVDNLILRNAINPVHLENSIVAFKNVQIFDSEGIGFNATSNSTLRCKDCKVVSITNLGFQSSTTSKIFWNGGLVDSAAGGSGIINGSNSFIGGGVTFKNGRFGASDLNADIRVSGTKNIIDNVFFDQANSTMLDAYITETTGASQNIYGQNIMFVLTKTNNIKLLEGSNSRNNAIAF